MIEKLTFARRISQAQAHRTNLGVGGIIWSNEIKRIYRKLLPADAESDVDFSVTRQGAGSLVNA